MFNTRLYEIMSPLLQEILISFRSLFMEIIKTSYPFAIKKNEINKTQWLSTSDIKNYQEKKLLKLIKHSIHNVPFYKDYCTKNKLNERDFRCLKDIKKLPIISKADVMENNGQFISKVGKKLRFKLKTSGTTGTPLKIFQDAQTIAIENAFINRQLDWINFRKGKRQAWIRGDMIIPFNQTNGPFWRRNYIERKLMMSSYHISKDNIKSYINALVKYDPYIINAYPSAIAYISKYILENKIAYSSKKLVGVLTSSETLTNEQKGIIEKAFKVPIYNWYGNIEKTVTMSTCECGSLHINSEYCLLEFLKINEGVYEIISTGLNNYLMPLIRYRTGDLVKINSNAKCKCGRRLPIVDEIYGRKDDYIRTQDGRMIGRTSQILKGIKNIIEGQIIQEAINEIKIIIVPLKGFNDFDRKKIVYNAKKRLGKNMKIKVEFVTKIERTNSGKFKSVISKI